MFAFEYGHLNGQERGYTHAHGKVSTLYCINL